MNMPSCNLKFCIHRSLFFFIVFIEQGVSLIEVLHLALSIRQPSGRKCKKKFLLCFHSKIHLDLYNITTLPCLKD